MINKHTKNMKINKKLFCSLIILLSCFIYFACLWNTSLASANIFDNNNKSDIVESNSNNNGDFIVPASVVGIVNAATGDIVFSDTYSIQNETNQTIQITDLNYDNKISKLNIVSKQDEITDNTYKLGMKINDSKLYDMYNFVEEKSVESDDLIFNPNTSQSLKFDGKIKVRGDIGDLFTGVDIGNVDFSYKSIDEAYAVIDSDNMMTFYYDGNRKTHTEGQTWDVYMDCFYNKETRERKEQPYIDEVNPIRVQIDSSFKNAPIVSTYDMFCDFKLCTSIMGLENINTSNVTNISYMFSYCWALTSLDLSSFNTSNVTNMSYMFSRAGKDTTNFNINLSNFDTSNVTNMSGMFYNCSSLTTLDVSYFDTSNVTNMSYMFGGCTNLERIYCDDDWSINPQLTVSTNMFRSCSKLPHFDSTKVDKTYAYPDNGETGYFNEKNLVMILNSFSDGHYEDSSGNRIESVSGEYGSVHNVKICIDNEEKMIDTVVDNRGNEYDYDDDGNISICLTFSGSISVSTVPIMNIHKLTFNANNDQNEQETAKTAYFKTGENKLYEDEECLTIIDMPTFDREGYLFNGYDSQAKEGIKILNSDGTFTGAVAGYTDGNVWTANSDISLYVNWIRMAVVTLNSFGAGHYENEDGNIINKTYCLSDHIAKVKIVKEDETAQIEKIVDNLGHEYKMDPDNYIELNSNIDISINVLLHNSLKMIMDLQGNVTFYYDGLAHEGEGRIYPFDETSGCLWDDIKAQIKTVNFDSSMQQANIVNCSNWFRNCYNLTSVNLSNLNITNALDLSCMFTDCISLKNIDLSSLITNPSANTYEMFTGCDFDSIKIGNGWGLNLANCGLISRLGAWQNSQGDIFTSEEIPLNKEETYMPINIVFVNLNAFNDGYWTDLNGNRINNLRGQAGEIKSAKFVIENKDKKLDYIIDNEGNLYTSTNNTIQVTIKENLSISIVLKDKIYDAKAVLDANGCFRFYYDDTSHEGEGRIYPFDETSGCLWDDIKAQIKTVNFDSSMQQANIVNCSNWFRNCYNLTSVNLSNLNITNALDLSCMFTDCISLKNIDLSSLITNPSANTYEMFTGCDFDSIKIGNGWGLNLANCGLISRLGAWQNSQGDIFTSEEIPLNKEDVYIPVQNKKIFFYFCKNLTEFINLII